MSNTNSVTLPKLKISSTPIFVIYCIDYRYDSMSSKYFSEIGYDDLYFLATGAGGSLSLGYTNYCKNNCSKNSKTPCDPNNKDIAVIKDGIIKNLNIALTLRDINTIYLLNHQECGALNAFLPCAFTNNNYDKEVEKKINADILTYSFNFILNNYPNMKISLGLIDKNGSIGEYDIQNKKWTVTHIGYGTNKNGLWYEDNHIQNNNSSNFNIYLFTIIVILLIYFIIRN